MTELRNGKTVAIIQAHMGSTRLPGKVMLDIAGKPMLQRVVERVQKCREVDLVCVATSTLPADEVIVQACRSWNTAVFRGSDADVLDRFHGAAAEFGAGICVRITSDCPLIDPGVSDRVIRTFKDASPPLDYASNTMVSTFPRGLDTEVFTAAALERAWRQATQPYERAHVTIYMYEHPQQFRLLNVPAAEDHSAWRWTVDTPEDLALVRSIYGRYSGDENFTWRDVAALLEREPALAMVNREVRQKAVHEG